MNRIAHRPEWHISIIFNHYGFIKFPLFIFFIVHKEASAKRPLDPKQSKLHYDICPITLTQACVSLPLKGFMAEFTTVCYREPAGSKQSQHCVYFRPGHLKTERYFHFDPGCRYFLND